MANVIRIKRSTGTSTPASLANAELAYSEGNDALYIGVGTGGAGGSATTIQKIAGGGLFSSQTAGYVYASPAAASGAPSFRSLAATDLPTHTHTTGEITGIAALFSDVAYLSGDNTFYGTVNTFSSPVNFSGATSLGASATATTPATADNSTKVATTAFVKNQAYLAAAGGTVSGNLTVTGTLTVNGGTTTINSTTLSVDDKNIELGSTASPTDATADGGGITLKGTTDKTLNWVDSTDSWTSNQHFNLLTGYSYKINGTNVLSATALGSGVTSSSLTSVGTITSGTWSGTVIAVAKGGTGATDAAGARTNLGLVIGTNVQAYDAELAAIAGLSSAADRLPYFTGSGTAALATFTAFGRSLVDDADAAAARSTLGLGTAATSASTAFQPADTELTALAGLTSAADRLPYFTGSGTASLATFSAFGRSLVDDADAAAARTTLALGSMATQNSNSVSVTGGTISGITLDNVTIDGGTW